MTLDKIDIGARKFKMVTKPWGHEEWWEPPKDHDEFMVKRIKINKGYRTSAHAHKQKIETTYVLEGTVRVWTGQRDKVTGFVDGKETLTGELTPAEFGPGDCFDIYPGQVHRVEALTDVLFIEISTKHPDDVDRFADDWNRGHGRIPGEHQE